MLVRFWLTLRGTPLPRGPRRTPFSPFREELPKMDDVLVAGIRGSSAECEITFPEVIGVRYSVTVLKVGTFFLYSFAKRSLGTTIRYPHWERLNFII